MKKILLTGYYGFDNLGDEAVLFNIIKEIRANIKDADITVLSHDPEKTAAKYNVKSVNRWRMGQTFAAIYRSDVLVFGGGSLLQDVTGSKSLSFYLLQMRLAHFLCKPVFLYAQGIGPVNDLNNQQKMANSLKKAALITVRDQESAAFLSKLQVPKERVVLTIDPVLAAQQQGDASALGMRKKIGIALRPWQALDDKMLDEIAAWADYFVLKGYKIVLLPFHEPQDRQISEKLAAKMDHQSSLGTEIFDYDTMLREIAELDFVLGMRLHAVIMAAAVATPFIGLSYDPKVESFCRSVGQPLVKVADINMRHLVQLTEGVLKDQGSIIAFLEQQKTCWRKLSKANTLLLNDVLEGKEPLSLDDLL
ncbi:MAG: polysaccharide pyruvyl transferase CsaB [Bacillota bacterium]|jgi:polysaccharide pyruvyl transferase CsaB